MIFWTRNELTLAFRLDRADETPERQAGLCIGVKLKRVCLTSGFSTQRFGPSAGIGCRQIH